MKINSRKFLITSLAMIVMMVAILFSAVTISPLTAYAAERDREIVAVDSGNSFNMRISNEGVLTWDEVTGATGYKVVLQNSMGQTINEWGNTLTNSRVFPFIVEMDNGKYDSGRYVIVVEAKDANKKNSMSYYYTSNVDKLEEPHGLQWIGNKAAWAYVDGAIEYTVSLYNFEGLVARKTVTECPVDLSEYNPQDGWTFKVQAKTNRALKDKRDSNVAESPKKGSGTRTVNPVDSGNALNMRITEDGILTWDEVIGATGYQVVLKNPIGVEIYRWDNDFTNNNRMLPIITEMDNLKIDSGDYRFEVEPKGAGSVAVIANYYYTSHVEQFEAPYNLKWNGSKATWTAVDGAASYDVTLYDFNGQVKTVTVTDDWYDFSEYNPQDGWTFKVQADGDGTSKAKRSSNVTESPAKTTSYNLTVVAYGIGNLPDTGKVSLETENGSQDFSTSVGGTFIKNTEVTVKAEANPGYEFVAWRVTTPENPEATLSTNATHTFNLTTDLQLFAVFRAIPTEYSVAYHGNGASGGMTGETVNAGGTHTLKECSYNKPYGKKFVGWAIGSADATPLKQPGEEITINADTTIYAVWEELYFTTQPTNTSGKIGKNVILPVEIDLAQVHNDDGYNIVLEVKNGENWEKVAGSKKSDWIYSDGFTIQQNSASIKEYRYKIYNGTEWIESDTFTVEFLPIIVTFVDNDHSTITEPIEVNTVGGKIKKPDNPTYSGDTFSGWNWPYWDFENQTVTQDMTMYAQWAGCGYYGDIPNVYAKLGQKAKVDFTNVHQGGFPASIYKYDGGNWVEVVDNVPYYMLAASDTEKTENYKIVIKKGSDLYDSNVFTVTWTDTLPTYYVSYGVGEGQGSGDADYDIEHRTNYPLASYEDFGTIIAPNGKVFDYWSIRVGADAMHSTEIAQKQAGETITVTSNVYVIAMWKNAPTVTVSYYSVGNIVDSDTVAVGTQHTLMDAQGLDVPSGKKFKAWAIGGLGGVQKQPGEEITITEETYIYAVWEDITYTVSFNANGGSGSMNPVEFAGEYTLPSCTFTAPTGKKFKGWATSANGEVVGATYNVTANVEFYAVWENIPVTNYTITATADANGTISPSGEVSVAEGEDKTFTITANSGYHIKDVKVNGASVGAVATYTFNDVAANATITVEFEVDTVPHVCNPTLVPKVEPNCTTAGKSAYYHCECGKNYEDAQGSVAIANLGTWGILNALGHDAQDVWSTDGEYHWHKCTRCEEQLDKAAHSGGTATCTEKAVCEVCNTPYGNTAAHDYGTTWQSDENNHWNECKCGDKANTAPHADANKDGKCDTCDYAMGTPENPSENIESEKTGLSGGAIAGIAVGSVAVAGLGGFSLFWFVIKKKKFADLIALFKKK